MSRPRHRVLVALVGAAVLSTAACIGGSQEDPSAGQTVTPPPEFTGVERKLPRGKALKNDPDLYENVALTSCKKADGKWEARGTATNPEQRPVDFGVLVFFTDAQARTVDWARATVKVGADGTENWSVSRPLQVGDARCVVRAVTSGS